MKAQPNPITINDDGSIALELTGGMLVLLDAEDYDKVREYRWHAIPGPHTVYAATSTYINKRVSVIRMHRLILPVPKGIMIDHVNRNGLDNRKINIRPCTALQNAWNAHRRSDNTSGYRGVRPRPGGIYQACISACGKRISLGYYNDPAIAARAYDEAAKIHFGEFANLNFQD